MRSPWREKETVEAVDVELPTSWNPEIVLALGLILIGLLTVTSGLLWRRSTELARANRILEREISGRKRAEGRLQLFQSLMHYSAEPIFVIDPVSARFLYVNDQAARQLGYSIDELLGITLLDILAEGLFEKSPEGWRRWVETLESSRARVVEGKYRRKQGETFPVELSVSMVQAEGRRFVVAIAEDISARRQKEEAVGLIQDRLIELSSVDGLTGVANRRLFDERLALEWKRAIRNRTPLSLIISDIDHFKAFNDRYGHLAGDECLKQVAETLLSCIARPADLVARFGGEELTTLLPDTAADGADAIAQRMRTAVEGLAIPHDDSPTGPIVTVSLGVGTINPVRDGKPGEFVEAVDAALYRAKRLGRNRIARMEL